MRTDKSDRCDDKKVRRREFKIASKRINIVFSSLMISEAFPKVQYKWDFNDIMTASQNPSKCGDLVVLNARSELYILDVFLIFGKLKETP